LKKMGRPPLPMKVAKVSPVSVRFSKDEHRAIVEAASRAGATISEWARKVLLSAATNVSTSSTK